MLNDLTFEYPWMFVLFVPLVAVLLWHWLKPMPSIHVPWLNAFTHTKRSHGITLTRVIPFVFEALAGIGLVLAMAGPRFGAGEITQKSKGVDILVAIDLSASMDAFDAPSGYTIQRVAEGVRAGKIKTRLEVSKGEIKKFIDARPNDRIGLIAFAARAYAVCPPTADHAWLELQLKNLELHSIGEGTGIAAPIASVITRLKDTDAKRKVMVLFTDGENTVPNKITPMQAAALAQKYDIVIHSVGIGSRNSYIIRGGWGGNSLMHYPDEYDEKLLRSISEKTGGRFYKAEDAEQMALALAEIDKLEPKTHETPAILLFETAAPLTAALAFVMLLIAFVLRRTFFLRYP